MVSSQVGVTIRHSCAGERRSALDSFTICLAGSDDLIPGELLVQGPFRGHLGSLSQRLRVLKLPQAGIVAVYTVRSPVKRVALPLSFANSSGAAQFTIYENTFPSTSLGP